MNTQPTSTEPEFKITFNHNQVLLGMVEPEFKITLNHNQVLL